MSYRVQRVNELIKKELGQIVFKELDLPDKVLLTLTRVQTAANLETARIYVSVFPENSMTKVLSLLNSQIYFFQQLLNKKLKMRPVPKVFFCQEKATVAAGRIDELLEQVKEEPVEKRRSK